MEASHGPIRPNLRFIFALEPRERDRIDKLIFTSGLPPVFWIITSICWGANFTLALINHRSPALVVLSGFACGLFAFSGLIIRFLVSRLRRVTLQGSLELSDAGFTGTLDRVPAQIAWCDIAVVRDLDTAIVLVLRRCRRAVAIPKTAIIDVPAFWALLEHRLVAERGLIRSSALRTSIANSKC